MQTTASTIKLSTHVSHKMQHFHGTEPVNCTLPLW